MAMLVECADRLRSWTAMKLVRVFSSAPADAQKLGHAKGWEGLTVKKNSVFEFCIDFLICFFFSIL